MTTGKRFGESPHPVRGARMPGEPIPGVTRYARTPHFYEPSAPLACEIMYTEPST
jgi:hypothetical protein